MHAKSYKLQYLLVFSVLTKPTYELELFHFSQAKNTDKEGMVISEYRELSEEEETYFHLILLSFKLLDLLFFLFFLSY